MNQGFLRLPSLSTLALVGTLLALLMPVLVLSRAFASLDDVARSGSEAALQARDGVGHARALVEASVGMERHARQAFILEDEQLMALYAQRRDAFVDAATALRAMSLAPDLGHRLEELAAAERRVHDRIGAVGAGVPAETSLADLSALSGQARAFLVSAEEGVLASAERIERDTQALRGRLTRSALLWLPFVLGVFVAGVWVIVRPLRVMDAEIRRLGEGDLDGEVVLRGPRDVEELGMRLEWMRRQLIQVEADRVRLFRHVSHELKTPLASLKEGAQLLSDGVVGPLTDGQTEIAEIMTANTALLQTRIEDLIRLSELRTGERQIELDPLDLEDLVRRLVTQHKITAKGRGLRFELALVPLVIQADAARLPPAIDNLLTNALKMGPADSVIRVVLSSTGGWWTLQVIDQGPGVPEEERERVFEPFFQGKAARTGYVQGTGIGLTIAREIARSHGGDIRLEANLDGPGACAVITAPIDPRSGAAVAGGRS